MAFGMSSAWLASQGICPYPLAVRSRAIATAALFAASSGVLWACGGAVGVELPRFDDGAAPGTTVRLRVPDKTTPLGVSGDLLASFEGRVPRYLPGLELGLLYRATPDALDWTPGRFAHDASALGRLRVPDRIMQRNAESEAWEPLPTDALAWNALALLRLPAPNDRCSGDTACYDEAGYCLPDCGPEPVIAPPRDPFPPIQEPCPAGIGVTETDVAGRRVRSCALVAELACPEHERAIFGGPCVPVGRTCTTDPWPAPPPSASVLYVSPAGSGAGNGTQAAPLDLDTAIASAGAGQVLLLAVGSYRPGTLRTAPGVTLYGACAAQAVFTVDTPRDVHDRLILDGVKLRVVGGLAVSGALRVEGAIIEGDLDVTTTAEMVGAGALYAAGTMLLRGRLDWSEGDIRDARVEATNGRVALSRVRFERSLLKAVGGGAVTIDQSLLQGIQDRATLELAVVTASISRSVFLDGSDAVKATGIGSTQISRSHFSGQSSVAISVTGAGAQLSIADSTLVAQRAPFRLVGDVIARLDRIAIGSARSFAVDNEIEAEGGGQRVLDIRDLLIARSLAGLDLSGDVSLERVRMTDLDGIGLVLHAYEDTPLLAEIADLSISHAVGAAIEIRGVADQSTEVRAARVRIDTSSGIGLSAREGPSDLVFEDLAIQEIVREDTAPPSCAAIGGACEGVGVIINAGLRGVSLTLERFVIEGAARVGVAVTNGADFTARHGIIRRAPRCVSSQLPDEGVDHLVRVPLACPIAIDDRPI